MDRLFCFGRPARPADQSRKLKPARRSFSLSPFSKHKPSPSVSDESSPLRLPSFSPEARPITEEKHFEDLRPESPGRTSAYAVLGSSAVTPTLASHSHDALPIHRLVTPSPLPLLPPTPPAHFRSFSASPKMPPVSPQSLRPVSTNANPLSRSDLIRKSRKLEQVLGETPHLNVRPPAEINFLSQPPTPSSPSLSPKLVRRNSTTLSTISFGDGRISIDTVSTALPDNGDLHPGMRQRTKSTGVFRKSMSSRAFHLGIGDATHDDGVPRAFSHDHPAIVSPKQPILNIVAFPLPAPSGPTTRPATATSATSDFTVSDRSQIRGESATAVCLERVPSSPRGEIGVSIVVPSDPRRAEGEGEAPGSGVSPSSGSKPHAERPDASPASISASAASLSPGDAGLRPEAESGDTQDSLRSVPQTQTQTPQSSSPDSHAQSPEPRPQTRTQMQNPRDSLHRDESFTLTPAQSQAQARALQLQKLARLRRRLGETRVPAQLVFSDWVPDDADAEADAGGALDGDAAVVPRPGARSAIDLGVKGGSTGRASSKRGKRGPKRVQTADPDHNERYKNAKKEKEGETVNGVRHASFEFPGEMKLSAKEKALNVRRAFKMAQVFGTPPPLSLLQISSAPAVPPLSFKYPEGSASKASLASLAYMLDHDRDSLFDLLSSVKPAEGAEEDEEPVDWPYERDGANRQSVVSTNITTAPGAGVGAGATPPTDANAATKPDDFQNRRRRAAKLSRFFGIGYHDLFSIMLHEQVSVTDTDTDGDDNDTVMVATPRCRSPFSSSGHFLRRSGDTVTAGAEAGVPIAIGGDDDDMEIDLPDGQVAVLRPKSAPGVLLVKGSVHEDASREIGKQREIGGGGKWGQVKPEDVQELLGKLRELK
ncbi:hypothetical protein BOTBODRAFT_48441 [Botryobasidium botryosum FD-172 SS1]|uniref:Uncharacterized protein n=1 Tax=Botryobasidium botryosum (strain FD-172 SS1) TaxID=930990 RepID=A0A067M8Z7_BOTB1|nr:hypothetical protein BOTBODRAFT_48441 [Botryobasidium botryosum FD-172 SS1]